MSNCLNLDCLLIYKFGKYKLLQGGARGPLKWDPQNLLKKLGVVTRTGEVTNLRDSLVLPVPSPEPT